MRWLRERMSETFGIYESDSPSNEKDKLQYIAVHGSNGSPIKYACLNPQIKIELFYDERKYISDFIDERTITQKWNPKIPVFISAQTGSGKSTFIRDVLLRYLKEHFGKDAKILFLYNRLALGRQNKLIAANQAPLYGSTASLNDINKNLTPMGIDKFIKSIGQVDYYSYQEFVGDCDINFDDYKFIIFDECHFFTSDARINIYTNEILNKIVSLSGNAVRIYMSATPEVAFEPIIKAEYEYLEKRNLKLLENSKPVLLVNNIPMVSDAELKSQYTSCLFIYFYYLKRNYDYISNVYVYENDENLVKVINEKASKKNKWLCFAHSKDAGAEMKKAITHSCAFITSDNKNNGEEKAFEKITNNKCFDEEVLIATSVLDNGISIEDENVCNIAIDQFDRVEFIQMLGRLRISNDSQENKINLYVKKYTLDDLKEIVKKAAQNLIYRLLADTVSYEKLDQITDENKSLNNTLDKNIIFIQPSNNKGQYNPCAIYAIVDFMGYVMKIIRKNDANYCISFPHSSYEAIRSNIIDYYKNGDGRNKSWSRSVIDVLESSLDFKQRNKYREEDLCQGMVEDRYAYMLEDNFLHYLFFERIPEYANNNEEHKLNKWLDGLSPENKNYVNSLFKRGIQQSNSRSLSVLEKMNIVKEDFIYNRFSEEQKREFNYYLDEIALNDAVTKYYRSLSEKEFTHPIDMQLNWIEKTECELLGENEISQNNSNENSCNEDDYFDFIVKNAVSEDELIKHLSSLPSPSSSNRPTFDYKFLEEHGFQKDSEKAKEISEKYLNGKSLMQASKIEKNEYRTIKIPIKTEDGEKIQTYRLMSCQANRKTERTFYVYVLLSQKENKNDLLSNDEGKSDKKLSSVDSKE